MVAQFGRSVPAFRSFGRIRRARNEFEYPSEPSAGPTPDDVDDAIATDHHIYDAAATVLNQGILDPW